MAQPPGGERTEAPTPKRIADARRRGDVLQSRELPGAMGVFAGLLWLWLAGPWLADVLAQMLRDGLTQSPADIDGFDPLPRTLRLIGVMIVPLVALALAVMAAAVATPAMLGALGWRSAALAPKWERVSPMAGLKRMFGLHGLIELARSVAKVAFLGLIVWLWMRARAQDIAALGSDPAPARALANLFGGLLLWLAGGFALIALIDVPVQYVRRRRRLMMSRQEVRDEHKQAEGAPEKKAAIRQRQMALLNRSMRAGIREASVVITNPQHFAVALRYRPGEDAAPIIVARGVDDLAAAIRHFAGECGVPRLAVPPLARALYFTGDVGRVIDARLYLAVATLLAFLFRLDRRLAEQAALPSITLPPDCRFDTDGRAEMA